MRNTDEKFESRLLPLFAKRTAKVAELIPQLYLHGLSEGDFDLALRGLLGENAPLSGSTVARLNDKWNGELAAWRARRLDKLEVVYVWVDGVYVKAGLEREKAAILVAIGALSDGSKTVLSVVPGYRESTESWSEVLRDLRDRGMNSPKLVVGDGHLGIWGALANVYPDAAEQRCWNHKIINVLERLPKARQEQAKLMLRSIPYAGSLGESERLKSVFVGWCREDEPCRATPQVSCGSTYTWKLSTPHRVSLQSEVRCQSGVVPFHLGFQCLGVTRSILRRSVHRQ